MATEPHIYSPIVKGKMYDLKALSHLTQKTKARIKPLVEAMPVPKESSIDEHLEKITHYIAKYYPNGPLFVDFYGFLPGAKTESGISAVIAGYLLLRKKNRTVTPCYGFSRDDSLWPMLAKVAKKFDAGFCFRIDIDDLDDAAEDTWSQILEQSAAMDLPNSQIDLFIDLRDIRESDVSELRELVIDFLSYKPAASTYRSIAIAGSSALKTVTLIPEDGEGDIERHELETWTQLQHELGDSIELVYGDYGIVHPDFSAGGPNKNRNSKIRYTSGNKIRYFRGHKLADPPYFSKYHELAERVRSSSIFRGADFSFGDQYVEDCADLNAGTGSLGTWVAADMNHHFEYTAVQIARIKVALHLAKSIEDTAQLVSVD